MSVAKSAAARRLERNAAIVAAHPRWLGIRHPELIQFPPSRRYSQLDVVRAAQRGHLLLPSRADRVAHSREVVAAHPRWRGIKHPERLVFPEPPYAQDPLANYQRAVLRALRGVRESERLCAEISAVADDIDRRLWPWAAAPTELRSAPHPPRRPPVRHRLRMPRIRLRRPAVGFHLRSTVRAVPH